MQPDCSSLCLDPPEPTELAADMSQPLRGTRRLQLGVASGMKGKLDAGLLSQRPVK